MHSFVACKQKCCILAAVPTEEEHGVHINDVHYISRSHLTICMGIWHKLLAEKNTHCQQEHELCLLVFPSLYGG